MRILIMGNNNFVGGLIVHYIVLAKYLRNAGHHLLLINVNDKGAKLFNKDDVNEIIIPFKASSIFKKVYKYKRLKQAVKTAKTFNPDLFIATSYGHGYALIASSLPASTFKFFEEVHFELHELQLKLKMVDCFDAIATQTQGMVEIFKKNISCKKPVAYLPCFSKDYQTFSFKPIPSTTSRIRIAYFGRLEWNKGIKQFIIATHQLLQNLNLELDIFGRGSQNKCLHDEINNKGLQNVRLKGFFDDKDFPEIISSYHGIVVPSVDTEGLPLIIIEAMRYGRPILCTTIGAMPEVSTINRDGMIVSEKGAEDLQRNLMLFIGAIRANKFSAETINNVYRNHFSNEAFWQVWERMLQDAKAYFTNN